MAFSTLLFSAEGRISRKTYWLTTVGYLVAYLILEVPVALLAPPKAIGQDFGVAALTATVLALIGFLVLAYSGIVVAIKRWHDRGKVGWWIFIGFVPIIGGVWAFIEMGCLRGTIGPNRFGPDPLGGYKERIGQVFDTPSHWS